VEAEEVVASEDAVDFKETMALQRQYLKWAHSSMHAKEKLYANQSIPKSHTSMRPYTSRTKPPLVKSTKSSGP